MCVGFMELKKLRVQNYKANQRPATQTGRQTKKQKKGTYLD
jgi:hypothetical protein